MLVKNKKSIFTTLIFALMLVSCSHQATFFSSRDITAEEQSQIALDLSTSEVNERAPADWRDTCLATARKIFGFNPKAAVADNVVPRKPLPELTQLDPKVEKFPNGKQYKVYRANTNVMSKYPDYDEFLEQTAEVIFEPSDPFGHIRLRVGKKVYSFSNVQWTQVNNFSPRVLKKSVDPEMPSSQGFVFDIGKEKIDAVRSDIDKLYATSASHNVPPFDAYSPLLKIVEGDNKKLSYVTTSPKFGNNKSINGKIVEEEGNFFLDAGNGVRAPVVKKGNDFYTQSYSCSSSAAHILEKFFGIKVSYNDAAKSILKSLENGNINEKISPVAVIKYYEE